MLTFSFQLDLIPHIFNSEAREWRHKNLDPPQDSDKQAGLWRKLWTFLLLFQAREVTILTQNDGVLGCKLEGKPANYTVEQWKRWLKCRGIKQTGKFALLNDYLKSGNSHILDSCIDKRGMLKALHLALTLFRRLVGRHSRPSQDLPSLWPRVYHYALESLPGEKNYNE